MSQANIYPKLHNAMWPGVVGKGPDSEPAIDLDTMLDLTCEASVDGVKFDGVDLFLASPHTDIDASEADIKALADKVSARGLVIGSVVAPVWPPVGGGSAMGTTEERARFVTMIEKACRITGRLRQLGVRPYGVIRIDTAVGVDAWAADPERGNALIVETFSMACDVAEAHGEQLAAEGEICWGGMHSWRAMLNLLEKVNRPRTLGFQADMAHTLLYTLGSNAPEDRILPADFEWHETDKLRQALKTMSDALRPYTIDFHVAQNDGTVKGMGSHDKTGRHCLATDPSGKLDVVRDAGYWMRGADGQPTRAFQHICWDGCMFPNDVMTEQKTWNDILGVMIKVRDAHGWGQ